MSRRRVESVVSAVRPVVLPLETRVFFDTTYYDLSAGPLLQNWSNTNLISVNNDWTAVPSITGFRGDRVNNNSGTDPSTLVDDSIPTAGNPINVTANQTATDAPTTQGSGGLYEFENPNSTNDPVVGFQGSGTADAPFIKIYLNTTGQTVVPVSYNLRDLDTTDTAIQQVVAQYRVGTTGDYTTIPLSYVADASDTGATKVTPVNFNLPAGALGAANLELRIMTADAVGSDAMIGVDDISIGGAVANTFDFNPAAYTVNESAGTVSLTVTRGNTAVASSVDYFTADNSAVAGSDYTATSGTLNFAIGTASQNITIPILNDSVAETLERFTVTLSNPVGGTLGGAQVATVSIADNDSVLPTGLLVNEVSANPPGTDTANEYIEVRGTAGQKLFNTYALSVEGDATANAGALTGVFDLSSGTVGSNGLLVVKGATSTLTFDPASGTVTNTQFDTASGGVLQNGANSYLIVYSPNAVPSADIDLNNDGVIDNLPAGATLLDGVGYITTNATAPGIAYGAILPQLTTTTLTDAVPDAVTRLPGNTTPLASAAFYGGDLEGTDNLALGYSTDATRITPNTPAGAALTPGATNFGATGDTTPPTITGTSFNFNVSATPMSLQITFSEDVQASLTAGDIVLQNLTNSTTIPTGNIVVSGYNTTTNTATVTFSGYTNGALPNGSYRLTIAAGSVSDAANNGLANAYTYDFFSLAGDANRDRKVDFNDFLILQNNFGQPAKTFSQGDFNFSGTVDFNDFLILQNNFNVVV